VNTHPFPRGVFLRRMCAWPAAVAASALAHAWTSGRAHAAGAGSGRWIEKAPLPIARAEVGVATTGGNVYVLGGYAEGRADQPLNQEYDPAAHMWRTRAPMPRGLNHVAAAGANGRIYAFGGFHEQNRNAVPDVNVYDVGYIPAGGLVNGGSRPSTTNEVFSL
jgi:hypothetical protein